MTELSYDERLARFERATEIIADYERQYDMRLPDPWRDAVPQLLRQGLTDPMLHDVFNALLWTEVEAGRRAAPQPD